MIRTIDQTIRIIKSTLHNHREDSFSPYFFIVGAGISAPEIPLSNKIIEECKNITKELDEDFYNQCISESAAFEDDPMKYYSKWIEFAFPNKLDRSNFFKKIISKSKISSANLMLAQILNDKSFANTVFTTNFDDSIKKALDLMGAKDFFVAENPMDNLVVNNQTKDIQIIHVHGTYNFYDCANLENEIDKIANTTGVLSSSRLLQTFLSNSAPIIVGYSGWENDVIMRCLKERLSYPTPLQYIWVCYNMDSYYQLPEWIRNHESVIFVTPEFENIDCKEEKGKSAFVENQNLVHTIDATTFFRRIISEIKISSPLIFSNPYLYYSNKIKDLLPQHEDILHLHHWAQRMKSLESNDNEFDRIVRNVEDLFIKKDYESAQLAIAEFNNINLSPADAEFVCFILLGEFLSEEESMPLFDLRYKFHISALEIIENNLNKLSNIEALIQILRKVVYTKHKYSENDRVISLFEKVHAVACKDERLLEVELVALGLKSSLVADETMKEKILKEIINKSLSGSKNRQLHYLRFLALKDLCTIVSIEEAITLIKQAEELVANYLNDQKFHIKLVMMKSNLIRDICDGDIKKQWMHEIIDLLSSTDCINYYSSCIEIASNFTAIPIQELKDNFDLKMIEALYIELLNRRDVNTSYCKEILEYARCYCRILSITEDDLVKKECCNSVVALYEFLPHKCLSYLEYLRYASECYLFLPNEIATDSEKCNWIIRIKNAKDMVTLYYDLVEIAVESSCVVEAELIQEDVSSYKEERKMIATGIELYCNNNHAEAEECFLKLIDSLFTTVSENAKANLLYMIRRKETIKSSSFWDVYEQIESKDPMILMNVMLYCIGNNDLSDERYVDARALIGRFSLLDMEEVIEWWGKIDIVGEEESQLVLSIVKEFFPDV